MAKLLDPKEVTFALVKIPIGSGTFARHKVVLCVATPAQARRHSCAAAEKTPANLRGAMLARFPAPVALLAGCTLTRRRCRC